MNGPVPVAGLSARPTRASTAPPPSRETEPEIQYLLRGPSQTMRGWACFSHSLTGWHLLTWPCSSRHHVSAQLPSPPGPHPNPGYLGATSHVSIFSRLSRDRTPHRALMATGPNTPIRGDAVESMKRFLGNFPLETMIRLVMFWRATGANLALAEPIVDRCTEAMDDVLAASSQRHPWHQAYGELLLQNSLRPLIFCATSTLESFSANFLGDNIRWETVGIFISAVIRATVEIPFFPPLYNSIVRRQELLDHGLELLDSFVETCLSMDRLNDLQLVLQYENFIAHSYLAGIHCE